MNEIATSMREAIVRLQHEVAKLPQVEPVTQHYFANGMYLRTFKSPANTIIVGKKHKTEHFFAVLSGHVQVTTEEGVKDIDATKDGPQILTSPIGAKRAILILDDALCMNVHVNPDNLTDIDDLESALIEDEPGALFDAHNKLKALPWPSFG